MDSKTLEQMKICDKIPLMKAAEAFHSDAHRFAHRLNLETKGENEKAMRAGQERRYKEAEVKL